MEERIWHEEYRMFWVCKISPESQQPHGDVEYSPNMYHLRSDMVQCFQNHTTHCPFAATKQILGESQLPHGRRSWLVPTCTTWELTWCNHVKFVPSKVQRAPMGQARWLAMGSYAKIIDTKWLVGFKKLVCMEPTSFVDFELRVFRVQYNASNHRNAWNRGTPLRWIDKSFFYFGHILFL